MSNARHAAMALHALAAPDREWMLSRLPGERAGEVRELLNELEALGLEADPAMVDRALRNSTARTAVEVPVPHAAIAAASAAQMLALLRGEPDRLVALVTSSAAWGWRPAFLAQLGPQRAERLADLGATMQVPAALRATVLGTVADRVQRLGAVPTLTVIGGHAPRWSLHNLKRRFEQRRLAWQR